MFVIAGVSGKVGAVVATELLSQKKKIKVLVRDAAKGTEWSKRGAEVAVGSLDDASFMNGALKGATGFFTLLPPNYTATDLFASQRKTSDVIAGAVKTNGVRHVVLLSSVGADLPEGNGPIRGLHYLENAVRGTGATLTAIRAGYFQENVANNLVPAREMGIYPNFNPSADAPMPMIATKDIGKLAAQELALQRTKNEIIDLHGPAYSARQVAEKLGAGLGKKLTMVDIPESGWVEGLMKAGFSRHIAGIFAEMYKGFSTGTIRPKGDRLVQGTTTLDETLKTVLGASAASTNLVNWFEIPVKDLSRGKVFYEQVFGVQLSLNEMGPLKMAWFPMGSGATGATGSLVQNEAYEPSHKGSLVYFSVSDIDATLARVTEKGGKVLHAKKGIGQHGFVAHFEDTEGNRVALHSMG